MSDSDLNYDEFDGLTDDENLDTEDRSEEIQEIDEVEQQGKESVKTKTSNYVDFDRDFNEQKEAIKGRISEYHRLSMTAQRELEQARAENEKLKSELAGFSKQKAPEPPDVDLIIDNREEFIRQQREYDEYQVNQRLLAERERENSERQNALRMQEIEQKSNIIMEDAKNKGIDQKMVQAGAFFLAETGMMESLKNEILGNPNAAEILAFLSSDEIMAAELYHKLKQDPVEARLFLRTDVKQKALSKFVKKSSAPAPTTKLSGSRGTENAARKGRIHY